MDTRPVPFVMFFALLLGFMVGAALPMLPQAPDISIREQVVRNADRIIELEHDIRALEAWKEQHLRDHTAAVIGSTQEITSLQTIVAAHERIGWNLISLLAGLLVDALYRLSRLFLRTPTGKQNESE